MEKDTNKETEGLSKSKEKREQRKKAIQKEKRVKFVNKLVGIIVAVVIAVVVIGAIGMGIYKQSNKTQSNSNFSVGLTSEGKIEGVDVASALNLVDYENMVVPMSEVEAKEEEVQNRIDSTLKSHQELKTEADLTVADQDKVSIDYVGTIDGIAFDGGDSNNKGQDLTIGSGTFIDGFEAQLIGHHPGEEVTVNVTFPEDYSSADLAGKDASFAVTIHGIYVTPELTDEFVVANLSDQASTAEEYINQVKDQFYQSHLTEYITKTIIEESEVVTYPKSFVKQLKGVVKYNDEFMLSYYNQMFASYGGGAGYTNVWDTRDGIDNEEDYEKELVTRAEESAKTAMVYQAIFEKAGLSIDMEKYFADLAEANGEESVTNVKETYGEGYLAQELIQKAVVDYLVENANVQ